MRHAHAQHRALALDDLGQALQHRVQLGVQQVIERASARRQRDLLGALARLNQLILQDLFQPPHVVGGRLVAEVEFARRRRERTVSGDQVERLDQGEIDFRQSPAPLGPQA